MKDITFVDAIQSLGFTDVCYFTDIPKSQSDLDEMFHRVTGTDDLDSAITETGTCPYTYSQLETERQRLQDLEDAKQYQQDRANAYPSIGDQLDMLWHAIDTGTLDKTSDFYTTLKAVKVANPKPSE